MKNRKFSDIYVLIHHKGQYEDYRSTNIKAFNTIVSAELYAERLRSLYRKAYNFYDNLADEISDGRTWDEMPDETWHKWNAITAKRSIYYKVTFTVESLKIGLY